MLVTPFAVQVAVKCDLILENPEYRAKIEIQVMDTYI